MSLTQHRLREIDANELSCSSIIGEGEAGANADFKNSAPRVLRRGDGGAPGTLENRTENKIIDGRPARIGLRNCVFLDLFPHFTSPRPPASCASGTLAAIQIPIATAMCSRWRYGERTLCHPFATGIAIPQVTGSNCNFMLQVYDDRRSFAP